MIRQKRKILLLIDNASYHPDLDYSNVQLYFFPANCTSEIQPLDQGVIKSFKSHYKYGLVYKTIDEIENASTNKSSILDAIYWVNNA